MADFSTANNLMPIISYFLEKEYPKWRMESLVMGTHILMAKGFDAGTFFKFNVGTQTQVVVIQY